MALMARYPDKYFDLAIVDPPYGINAEHGTNRAARKMFKEKAKGWDSSIPNEEYFNELFRVSKNQIIWGGNYFLEFLPSAKCFLIWDKLNPDRNFADCELAWTSLDKVARIYKTKRVQELNKDDGGKIHPTQKPSHLYSWILNNYATKGDKILDTHIGSGSIRLACADFGVELIGSELDNGYFNAQEKRYKQHISQTKLF